MIGPKSKRHNTHQRQQKKIKICETLLHKPNSER